MELIRMLLFKVLLCTKTKWQGDVSQEHFHSREMSTTFGAFFKLICKAVSAGGRRNGSSYSDVLSST